MSKLIILKYEDCKDFRDHAWLGIVGCVSDAQAVVEATDFYKVSEDNLIIVRQEKRNGRIIYWARLKSKKEKEDVSKDVSN